jgi:hypothetical protein
MVIMHLSSVEVALSDMTPVMIVQSNTCDWEGIPLVDSWFCLFWGEWLAQV